MTRQSFVRGAVVLVTASLATRVLGMFYRIYLARVIGPEGMGLFQMVAPMINLIITLVLAGLPNAIAKLVAEAVVQRQPARVRRILRLATGAILSSAILFTVVLYTAGPALSHRLLADPRAYYAFVASIPVILAVALSSIIRGYFQGVQNMRPIAASNILEAITRIAVVFLLAPLFLRDGLAMGAALASIGMVAGEVVSLAYLLYRYRRERRALAIPGDPDTRPLARILRQIGEIAVPVTISRVVGSLGWWAESSMIPRVLVASGLSAAAATTLFGQYASMAFQLLIFPTVFTGAMTTTLIPSVSEAAASHHRGVIRRRLRQSFRMTAFVGLPASAFLTIYATPICQLLYNDAAVGPIVAIMAPFGFFVYFNGPLAGILQGLNRAGRLMVHSVMALAVRLFLIQALGSVPSYNISGVAMAYSASAILQCGLNYFAVRKTGGSVVDLGDSLRFLSAASLTAMCLLGLRRASAAWSPLSTVLAGLLVGSGTYFVLTLSLGAMRKQDLHRVPRIGTWLACLAKWVPFAH